VKVVVLHNHPMQTYNTN